MKYRLTVEEYCKAIKHAVSDDERWPHLERFKWLIDHTAKEGSQIIIVDKPEQKKGRIYERGC